MLVRFIFEPIELARQISHRSLHLCVQVSVKNMPFIRTLAQALSSRFVAGVVRRAQIWATTMLIQSLVHVARGPVARRGLQTELFFICSTSQQKCFFYHPSTPFISSFNNEEEHLNAFCALQKQTVLIQLTATT